MQIQPGMFVITRYNAGFGAPEFYANGGCTLHTEKAVKAFSIDEACEIRKLAERRDRCDRWAVVAAEDVSRLPGWV